MVPDGDRLLISVTSTLSMMRLSCKTEKKPTQCGTYGAFSWAMYMVTLIFHQ